MRSKSARSTSTGGTCRCRSPSAEGSHRRSRAVEPPRFATFGDLPAPRVGTGVVESQSFSISPSSSRVMVSMGRCFPWRAEGPNHLPLPDAPGGARRRRPYFGFVGGDEWGRVVLGTFPGGGGEGWGGGGVGEGGEVGGGMSSRSGGGGWWKGWGGWVCGVWGGGVALPRGFIPRPRGLGFWARRAATMMAVASRAWMSCYQRRLAVDRVSARSSSNSLAIRTSGAPGARITSAPQPFYMSAPVCFFGNTRKTTAESSSAWSWARRGAGWVVCSYGWGCGVSSGFQVPGRSAVGPGRAGGGCCGEGVWRVRPQRGGPR